MKKIYNVLTVITIICIVLVVASIVLWGLLGVWIPFVVALPLAITSITLLFIIYFKNVKFECPTCHTIFKGNKWEIFWAYHTPTKRKMTCPNCKEKKWCKDIFD